MSTYNKEFLLSKLKSVEFPIDLFTEETSHVKELIFSPNDASREREDNCGKNWQGNSNFPSSCFIISQDEINSHSPTSSKNNIKKSPDRKGSISWRKHSENDRKGDLKESREVDIKINGMPINIRRNSSSIDNYNYIEKDICICQESKLVIGKDNMSKLSQVLKLMKTSKKKNKIINIKNIFQINEKLNLTNDTTIWYINGKKGIGCNYDILFGPFSSNQIADFYEKNNLNENSELRLYLDFEVPEFNPSIEEIMLLNGKDFKLKEMCKYFNIQDNVLSLKPENGKKKKFSTNEEDMYFNSSLYKIVLDCGDNTNINSFNNKGKENLNTNNVKSNSQKKSGIFKYNDLEQYKNEDFNYGRNSNVKSKKKIYYNYEGIYSASAKK